MKLSTDVKPITYLKNRTAELVDEVTATRRPVAITQHGEPKVVIMDVASYDMLQESLAMLKLVAMGQQDLRAGRAAPQREVFRRLRRRVRERTGRDG